MPAKPLDYGVANKHILKSYGGDSDVMKFYCTTNNTTYGRKWAKFEPRSGRHTGTGYVSNHRPGVYYSARIDEVDNPAMGRIVADNYHTITERSFRPLTVLNGTEAFPNAGKQAGSGFVRERPLHIPTFSDVKDVCLAAKLKSAPADILPRHRAYLQKIQPKNPIELENLGYGPGCNTTETSVRFRGEQPDRSDLNRKSIGFKEDSGFTHNHNVEPVQFHPDYAFQGDAPGYLTDRPTGLTITKTHFLPMSLPNGAEALPRIAIRSDRESGYNNCTKPKQEFAHKVLGDAYDKAENQPAAKLERTKKQDPMEYLNMIHPNNYSSVMKNTLLGKQYPDSTVADRLGTTSVGWKEETGFTENNDKYTWHRDNPARFITDYSARFLDRTPKGTDREGHTWGGTLPPPEDGFTKNTRYHGTTAKFDSTAVLRSLDPYVSRSIKARDTYCDEHLYDYKQAATLAN